MENATLLQDENNTCLPPAQHIYDSSEKAFVTILLLFIVCGTVFGNILVFLSLLLVKKLRTPSNLLLLSLSVSDLSIALTVEPFALYKTVNVRWDVPHSVCQIYLFLDVMLCTASILNLNVITIDRYLVITRPFQYSVRRTPRLMATFIAFVWLLAIAISSAAFAWPPGANAETVGDCYYTQELSYQMYATVAAFYLPLTTMLLLWARIFVIARKMANADRAQQCRVQQNASSSANQSPGQIELRLNRNQLIESALITESASVNQLQRSMTNCTCRERERDRSQTNVNNGDGGNNNNNNSNNSNGFAHTTEMRRNSYPGQLQMQMALIRVNCSRQEKLSPNHIINTNNLLPSPANSQLMLSSDNLADSEINANGYMKKAQSQHVNYDASLPPCLHRARTSTTPSIMSNTFAATKRKVVTGENKALVTIATIMTCFTLCWLPFFLYAFINPIYALIVGCDIDIGHHGRTLLLWLGYANSFMNPLIYCKFNRDFRRPFIEFLKCHCRDVNARLRIEQYVEQYGIAPAISTPSIHQIGALGLTVANPTAKIYGFGKKMQKRKNADKNLTRKQAEDAGLLTPCTQRSKIPQEHILLAQSHQCETDQDDAENHKELFECIGNDNNRITITID